MARILVVEDDAAIVVGLRDDLTLEGHEIEVAGDGPGAIARAMAGAWDLVILDVMLPRKDGFQVCRELRHSGFTAPIIMLTARAHEAEKVMGLEIGADDYVTKPFSPAELRARVKAVLRRGGGDQPDTSRFGDIEVDFVRFELRRAGTVVAITPIEFKLLAAFVRHNGIALSRARLTALVWGPETALTDRVVDTHVANLRRKVEPEPASPRFIRSVRGLGYRFDG